MAYERLEAIEKEWLSSRRPKNHNSFIEQLQLRNQGRELAHEVVMEEVIKRNHQTRMTAYMTSKLKNDVTLRRLSFQMTEEYAVTGFRLNNGEKRKCHHKMASFARCDGVIWSQRAKMG